MEDGDGADKTRTADKSQRTEDVNAADNLGTNSRQAIEDINEASYGRRRLSGQPRYKHKYSRLATKNANGADKIPTIDKSQKT